LVTDIYPILIDNELPNHVQTLKYYFYSADNCNLFDLWCLPFQLVICH